MKRARIIFLLHCYTDGDWCFKKEPEEFDWNKWSPCFIEDYKDYQFDDGYSYRFAFELDECDVLDLINFLEDLKKDLHYSDHDWAREQVDGMINPAIEFLQAGKDGTYFGTVRDGNWQPTALVINRETFIF